MEFQQFGSSATTYSPTMTNSKLSIIVGIFNETFVNSHNTLLLGNGHEPIYQPCLRSQGFHKLVFRSHYLASACHEISHWCLAGAQRRLLSDFGYDYIPSPRSPSNQEKFLQFEARPQACEWLLLSAIGESFYVSFDNIGQSTSLSFKQRVYDAALKLYRGRRPQRLEQFLGKLVSNFGSEEDFHQFWLSMERNPPKALDMI